MLTCRKASVTLSRQEWEELVMEHIQALTDKLHAREDLSLACRCGTLLAPMALLPLLPT